MKLSDPALSGGQFKKRNNEEEPKQQHTKCSWMLEANGAMLCPLLV